MYDTILVPTDGSQGSIRAAEYAVTLAEAFGASVHLLAVVGVPDVPHRSPDGPPDDELHDRLEADARTAIDTVADAVGGAAVTRTAVVEGDPSESILDYAAEHDADVVAMGTHGRTGVDRYVAGSVTERVVRRAPVPVLTVRATERRRATDGFGSVLVPTDGSEYAAVAVEHAVAIARRFDARVHAVSVVDLGDVGRRPNYTPPADLVDRLDADARAATERIATRARAAGCEAVTAVSEGAPASALLDYADETDVDCIAMGTAGRTGSARYLLGSTTERIVRHADVPVLAVDAGERSDA